MRYFPPKTCTCDGCGKVRRDVQIVSVDGNGDPVIGLCFICRKADARRMRRDGRDPGREDVGV